jgi:hypothetical protein
MSEDNLDDIEQLLIDFHAYNLPPTLRWGFIEWCISRPKSVQELIKRFPPNSKIIYENQIYYVVGYNEDIQVLVSLLNPHLYDNYQDSEFIKEFDADKIQKVEKEDN